MAVTTCSSAAPVTTPSLLTTAFIGTIIGQAGNDRALLGDGSDAAIGDNNGVNNVGDAGNDYLAGGSDDDVFLIGDSSWTDMSATFEGQPATTRSSAARKRWFIIGDHNPFIGTISRPRR